MLEQPGGDDRWKGGYEGGFSRNAHWRHGRHARRLGLEDISVGAVHYFNKCLAALGPPPHSSIALSGGAP